jgi:hypothetical protein
MKFETYDKYLATDTALPPQALLTAWDCLADFREDLVLVGGLAVRYLTKPPAGGQPGPVTIDVDFGVSIGEDAGMGPSIRHTLHEQGFKWANQRFVRSFTGLNLYIDLLTDDGKSDRGTVVVDDGLHVSVLPGIDRALACVRQVAVTGPTLKGETRTEMVKVAEVGPMLALKLSAFNDPSRRQSGKDVHDILHLVTRYLDGQPAAVAAFKAEHAAGNRAMRHALACLQTCFPHEDAEGPIACAAFRLSGRHETPELADVALGIRRQCVGLAQALLE